MNKAQTLQDFYQIMFNGLPEGRQPNMGHFNVFRTEDLTSVPSGPVPYSRRDYYKIGLVRGKRRYHFANKSIETGQTTLVFFNPQVPYTWEAPVGSGTGYFCIFNEGFFTQPNPAALHQLPMFRASGNPAYALNDLQDQHVSQLFEKMSHEIASNYPYKYDLLRNYVSELIHYAMKLHPSEMLYQHPNAKARITAVFRELLERQFPIESPAQRFRLRSANDFAGQLSVHVNHLNRSVRETTGKTTTEHIAGRLANEARALLKHTDWNVAQISYSLGFEEPAHFTNFFRKQTGLTPTSFRNA